MNWIEYLSSKAAVLLGCLLFYGLFMFFLLTLGVQPEIWMVFTVLFLLMVISLYLLDYYKRKRFYTAFFRTLNDLEQKTLIDVLIQRPGFLEGDYLLDALEITNQDMNTRINSYQQAQRDYQEYIELWIHEIKTPLTSLQLLVSNHPHAKQQQMMKEITSIQDYVEQVLYYSRTQFAEKDYLIKAVNLQDCVDEVLRKYASTFIEKQIKVDLHHLDRQVLTDSKWIVFILAQLVSNALKYMPSQSGLLSIYTTSTQRTLSLHLDDNGIGIRASDLYRVFEKGFTGENGRSFTHATGMGLYLCKQLTLKLNLGLEIASEHGTQVIVRFPLDQTLR